ncbi:magnesium transporter CorA family protein [Neptuniibacter sp. 2_MG-2023]|uniref:magnesium transporter CorA family protein n=1 Tax=Neptuniibacter sp. 2_MG-2023 TaxID=3062671 RepID=UPI0026E2C408|nr:magnesium transporter CorA family protein [Neptuniibacter sp. 2_MG-2023]MDO6512591.1 magnesium transporter CorA family protein [Neptuniibacter sp. 2_MG-2023]
MVTTYWKKSGQPMLIGNEDQIAAWQNDASSFIWIDIQYTGMDQQWVGELLSSLNCNALAVKDVLRTRHPPKIELFQDQTFILYRGISDVINELEYNHQQIGFFINDRYLVTVHPEHSMGISQIIQSDSLTDYIEEPMLLALKIMHNSSDTYLSNMLNFEDELGLQEDALLAGEGERHMAALAGYRIKLLRLKRIFNYHQQMFAEFCSHANDDKASFIQLSKHEHYLTDVYERFERIYSLSSLYYEMCSDMVEGYISISSHQQNVSMRVLTVITAIFVPLSFLAGLYGMNFDNIPELHHPNAYYVLLSTMFIISFALIVLFKRKKWI